MSDRRRPSRSDEPRLAPSLLDRLIDLDPDLSQDRPVTEAETIVGLRAALRRDLEILLNTRAVPRSLPPHLPQLADSSLAFGAGDFFSAELGTEAQRAAFAKDVRERIERFEPRLSDLSVTLISDPVPSRRHLRLRIAARHIARPGLPPVMFETAMDPVAGHFTVSDIGGGSGRRDG
ncbi:type VI secretion system baseplate subunit TssE [Tateyamaria omphalii]|uniref:type VI secretion system baseplate subunit TssE n=1 Tax=Tateyamaria omphalii TaxID=299262 RepID=UPI001C99D8E8|nr:type VI secretion system baseplate subunit TssE [Tateyamaria omphalii]MBY5931947.1 type VI secretion system baseplate subunit TssE [Tateyamaria omphalii]